jgi:HlyD family secretion protein
MTQDTADAAPANRRLSRRRAVLISAIALILIAAIALVAVSCTNSGQNGPPTVRVDRGPVALAVSASGTIAPSGRQSLGFADGGTVTQVAVKVGDRVEAGQVIARIDGRVALQTLRQQQATLNQQAAVLDKLRGGDTVGAAQASLDQASSIERATRSQVDATNAANRSATSRARTQLRFDQSSLDRAEDQLQADRSACRASPRTTTPTTAAAPVAPTASQTPLPTTQPRPTTQPVPQPQPTSQPRPTTPPALTTQPRPTTPPRTTTSLRTVTTSVVRVAASGPLGSVDGDVDLADERTSPACQRILSDRSAVQQAEAAVVASRTALDAAEQRENTDAEAGQVPIENARQGVVTAQNQLATASNDRAPDISAQEALVESAQAGVAIAQRDVDETAIIAPVAGTITAINGAPGEVVAPPSAVTPLAPGGSAPLPVEASGGTAGAAVTGAPGAGAFVVLDAADPFQLVVPFEEADASRILPGQLVDVAVDALPNDTLTGRVSTVAPSGQDISGIVSYYTTIVVDGGADRLRDGQTAEAAVRVEAVENALRVPAAAVGRSGGRPTVTVTGPDGEPVTRSFLPGLVGDDYVEVRSGLTDGEEVRLPQATVTTAPGPQGPPPAN